MERDLASGHCIGLAALICNLTLAAPAVSAHESFSIEEVMQAPYPAALTAAPTGKSVAWVFNEKGCRNIWIAESAGAARATQVTTYEGDNGYDIGDLDWSPDAHSIAYTRGQALKDESPANVNSSPDGAVSPEVWIVRTTGAAPRKLGAGYSPKFSPDGSRLVFVSKNSILSADLTNESAARPLVIDSGQVSSLTWSDDGRHLAFVSNRRGHALVGVYDTIAHSIVWLAPSLDHDDSPTFSPDGSQLAFIRIPSEKTPVLISHPEGRPWSLWIADVSTGRAHRVWSADSGAGSVFHPTLSSQNLFWGAHDELFFPWEKTGWLQLYAVPVNGGGVRALTSGHFEVTHVAFSKDRARLVYSSNEGDIDRLHVWTLNPHQGHASRIVKGGAIEDYPQISADGTVYALQSDGTKSLQPVVASEGSWNPLARQSVPESFPTTKLVSPETVTFPATDGQEVHAQIFLPNDSIRTAHPAILFFHGGPRRQMLLGFNPTSAYNWMYSLNEYFVSQGYIVLSVNYRGGIGYGLQYREAKDFGPGGGSEINDLLGSVTYLKSRKDVDASRIGIWGASYGGLMTALGLARASGDIAAGVDYAGVYDWVTFFASIGIPIDGGAATDRAIASSPIATINQWRSPVLVVQADEDRSVPSEQASELIDGLRSHHIDHDEMLIPNEIHDLARYASWLSFFHAAAEYFQIHLGSSHVQDRR